VSAGLDEMIISLYVGGMTVRDIGDRSGPDLVPDTSAALA
jgi:hypothetical protein